MNRLIKHVIDAAWVRIWSVSARLGIGDPLNQLVYVAPFRVVEPAIAPPLQKQLRAPRVSRKVAASLIKQDMRGMGQPRRKQRLHTLTKEEQ